MRGRDFRQSLESQGGLESFSYLVDFTYVMKVEKKSFTITSTSYYFSVVFPTVYSLLVQ